MGVGHLHADPRLRAHLTDRRPTATVRLWRSTQALRPKESQAALSAGSPDSQAPWLSFFRPIHNLAHCLQVSLHRAAKHGLSYNLSVSATLRIVGCHRCKNVLVCIRQNRPSGATTWPQTSVLHSVRHTFLTRLGLAGVDAFTIMRLAGHGSVAMSQRYVHPTPASLETAIAKLDLLNSSENSLSVIDGPLQNSLQIRRTAS
jgi:hypothetical protein